MNTNYINDNFHSPTFAESWLLSELDAVTFEKKLINSMYVTWANRRRRGNSVILKNKLGLQ